MKNKAIIILIMVLCFTQGIFVMLELNFRFANFNQISLSIQSIKFVRFIVEILIIIFFIKIISLNKHIKLIGLKWWLLFLIISIISGIYNNKSIIEIVLFLRKYSLSMLFFWAVYNSNLKYDDYKKIFRLIVFFLILQIPITIIKYFAIGITEQVIIGTLDPTAGGLPAILPMAVVGFSMSLFLYKKISYKLLLFIILSSVFFGLIGSKRASIFYISMNIVMVFLYYSFHEKTGIKFFKLMPIVITIAFAIIYFGVRFLPTLNPDQKIMGHFDYEYLVNYMDNYSSRSIENAEGSGRRYAWSAAYSFLNNRKTFFIGTGAGDMTYSSLTGNIRMGENYKYNLGYGVGIAMLQVLLQIGFFGVIFYALIYLTIFSKLIKKYKNTTSLDDKSFILGSIAVFFTMLWDSYSYSQTSIGVISFIYPTLFISAFALKIPFNTQKY